MVIFFAIFFALIAVNASLLIFSAMNTGTKFSDRKESEDAKAAKIYPLDLDTSEYKKAI
ncbi:MAG: hypothetical protein KJO94_07625 [Eudoraea sp.]|nr:hypothetical protein [Eudoraea sp.]MBT8323330.1 hypothetical protein [Eudoraea sp.]NNJ39695.1 hypothetical protein [Eudoraea sp.]